jgi:hypothetical protein
MPNNIINASSSGSGGLITTAADSGTLELQSNGTTIATISSTGLQQNVGAPAFSAYQSTSQTGIANSTWTKQTYDTEEYDTNSNFASSRFTPTVAGYYLFTASVLSDTLMSGRLFCALYKNGTVFKQGAGVQSSSARLASILSAVAYANGSTDYFELYAFSDAGVTWITNGGFSPNYFQASMIRSA